MALITPSDIDLACDVVPQINQTKKTLKVFLVLLDRCHNIIAGKPKLTA